MAQTGALVISLDFELHWGVREYRRADGDYRQNLLGARTVIPRLLELFGAHGVAATWATVGFLFARSKEELEHYTPALRPDYIWEKLDPYRETIGRGEEDDPLHYAPSLIEAIGASPRQEIGSHTFSHYYCLEPRLTPGTAAFEADLRSAVAIAAARGFSLRSMVFPQNQIEAAHVRLLAEHGIRSYRGTEASWLYRGEPRRKEALSKRLGRMADAYIPLTGNHVAAWSPVPQGSRLTNVPASRFLRPFSPRLRALEPLRLRRIGRAMRAAARNRGIFHLWWHPHNFGTFQDENLAFLQQVLEVFEHCRQEYGMRSLTMAEAADCMRADAARPS